MNKLVKKAVIMAMSGVLTASMLPALPAQAAKKKLSVNKVYDTTTKVKGKTKKKYQVRIKIGKKTYKATATKKGNYSVKIPKQAAGKALTVKAYRKKGKKWKYYTKKKTYVLAKTISVSKFSKTSKTIKGYARPKYKIKVTRNGKTYTKKASSKKGYFSVKMKKAAGNATATIKLYNTKGKYVKSTKKKAYNASSSGSNNAAKSDYTRNGKPYYGKLPGLEDPIDLSAVERKMNDASSYVNNTIYCESDTTKNFYNLFSGYGQGEYGYVPYYMKDWSDNEYQWYTAKNGVSLYYVTAKTGKMQTIPTPDASKPETYEGVIKSGQTGEFSPTYRNSRNLAYMGIKIVGYKNGKPVMFYSACEQLIAGTVGKPVVIK